ncbi:MAG: hypothetical protein HXY35_15100 [Chloroflexi bacterium]|nr:hypothetical protein [Chloroflexota bacterium]
MRGARLGCLTGTGIFAALVTAFAIAGYAFASGGTMFSPGSLNSERGLPLGGVSSHAEIAGDCGSCHSAPWEPGTMDDRCIACHADITAQMGDLLTEHGRMYAIDPEAQCRDCHTEHHGPDALLTVLDGWKYPHELSGYMLDAHQFKAEKEAFKCADCHAADVTVFDLNVCSACHRLRDAVFMVDHVAAYGASCLDCHDGVDRLGKHFTHDQFVFKLTGKHLEIACETCHTGARILEDYKKTPQDCASCHGTDDPHAGTLGSDCASCHSPDGWTTVHFDHNRSAFKLLSGHENVACENCHIGNVFKGTPADCFSCHQNDDPHKGTLGQDCESCHKATTWQDVDFDHSRSVFPLIGKHVSVACENCHQDALFKNAPTDCASCHTDVHSGQMGRNCADCHNPRDWKDVDFNHSKTGFPLIGGHSGVACANCHVNGRYKGTPSNCYACHAAKDPHGGQFGSECGSCHKPTSWKDVNFDHGKTGFPLNGGHGKVQCKACHSNGVFKDTPRECVACHAKDDAHNGQFGTVCSACHDTSKWKNATFNHGNTGFPLAGSHANVACKSCHANNTYKGTPKNCFACHSGKDAHKGQFGTDCGSCHKPTKWSDVSFNHGNTGFPLSGKHNNVQCKACHANGYKGTPTNCYACHANKDEHNGQFGTNCGSCHTPSGWGNATFNHNNTGFPLVGKHAKLNCTKCHSNGTYKGTPTQCVACHKDKHNGENGNDCSKCHTPKGWGD